MQVFRSVLRVLRAGGRHQHLPRCLHPPEDAPSDQPRRWGLICHCQPARHVRRRWREPEAARHRQSRHRTVPIPAPTLPTNQVCSHTFSLLPQGTLTYLPYFLFTVNLHVTVNFCYLVARIFRAEFQNIFTNKHGHSQNWKLPAEFAREQ